MSCPPKVDWALLRLWLKVKVANSTTLIIFICCTCTGSMVHFIVCYFMRQLHSPIFVGRVATACVMRFRLLKRMSNHQLSMHKCTAHNARYIATDWQCMQRLQTVKSTNFLLSAIIVWIVRHAPVTMLHVTKYKVTQISLPFDDA